MTVYNVPDELPILPLRNTVAFPFTIIPLTIGIERSMRLIEDAQQEEHLIGLVAMKDSSIEEPQPGQVYETGTLARIERVMQTPDQHLNVIVHCLERFKVQYWTSDKPYLQGAHSPGAKDVVEDDVETKALQRSLLELAREVVSLSPNYPKEAAEFLAHVKSPRYLAYLVANYAGIEVAKAQEILEADDVKDKLRMLIAHLSPRKGGPHPRPEDPERGARGDGQGPARLLPAPAAQGHPEGARGTPRRATPRPTTTRARLEKAGLPQEARKEAEREMKRLRGMSPQSPEASMIKTYLDWLVDLPWSKASEDKTDDRERAHGPGRGPLRPAGRSRSASSSTSPCASSSASAASRPQSDAGGVVARPWGPSSASSGRRASARPAWDAASRGRSAAASRA